MANAITQLSMVQQALAQASTPAESKKVEAMAAAAKAWAKEQGDYELEVEACETYIKARRKTTGLIEPNIIHGDHGLQNNRGIKDDTSVLADFNLTKLQWQRRKKELEITDDELSEYIINCIEKQAEPTTFGLLHYCEKIHVSNNSGENEWYTPPEYIEAARSVMGGIDLDPASSDQANETVKAETYYTVYDDGLEQEWHGRVWMNPPYSQPEVDHFSKKLQAELSTGHIDQALVLVNNATETKWFQGMLRLASAICFITGRVKFIDQYGNPSGAPLQGQAVLYFGDKVDLFSDKFGDFGIILYGR